MTTAVIFKIEGQLTGWCFFRAQAPLSHVGTPTPLGGLHRSEESARDQARYDRTVTTVDIDACADTALAEACRRVGTLAIREAIAAIAAAEADEARAAELVRHWESMRASAASRAPAVSETGHAKSIARIAKCKSLIQRHRAALADCAKRVEALSAAWRGPFTLAA